MQDKPVALITRANQGIGLQIAKDLMAHGFTVLVGSRNLERDEACGQGGWAGPAFSTILFMLIDLLDSNQEVS